MGTTDLFPQSRTAYDRYSRGLSRVTRDRLWIFDPSYALSIDPDVYVKIERDAVTAHAMGTRRRLASGRAVIVKPAVDDEPHKLAAKIVDELLDQVFMFTSSRAHLAQAIFRGSAYAMIQGEFQQMTIAGVPARWWVPRRLRDIDRRRFLQIATDDGPVWMLWSVSRRRWEPLEFPQWFVRASYDETEDSLAYGKGLVDAIHFYQASKMRVLQEGLSACERFGQGAVKVAIDGMRAGSVGKDNTATVDAYLTQIKKNMARHVLAHDKEDQIEILQGFGEGWQLIKELLDYLDNAIRVAVLGSNLPTSATGGGSFALAAIQENSTEAMIQFDRDLLGEVLTRDLVGLVWSLNRTALRAAGLAGVRPPRLQIRQDKREDHAVNSRVIATALQSGVKLKAEEVYERLGFTIPGPDDEVIEPIAAPGVPPMGLPTLDFAALRAGLEAAHNGGGISEAQAQEWVAKVLRPAA